MRISLMEETYRAIFVYNFSFWNEKDLFNSLAIMISGQLQEIKE